MKWLLLLTILSGYSGSSTVAANFDSKEPSCEAAAKSQEQAIRELHWHSFAVETQRISFPTMNYKARIVGRAEPLGVVELSRWQMWRGKIDRSFEH